MRSILAILALIAILNVVRADITIDGFNDNVARRLVTCAVSPIDFSDPSTYNNVNASCAFNSSFSGATIVGGEREMFLQRDIPNGGLGALSFSSGFIISAGPGIFNPGFSFSIEAGSSGTLVLIWDGVDGADGITSTKFNGLLPPTGLDMTQGGLLDTIQLRLTRCDLDGTIQFTFYEFGATGAAFKTAFVDVTSTPNTVYIFPFNNMTGNADLTRIGAISMFVNSSGDSIDLLGGPITITSLLNATKLVTYIDANGDGFPSAGENVMYTIRVDNIDDGGNYNATNTILVDPFPANTVYIPNSARVSQGSVSSNGTAIIALFGTVYDGTSVFLTFNVTLGNLGCGLFNISNQGLVINDAGGRVPTDGNPNTITLEPTILTYRGADNYTMACTTARPSYTSGEVAQFNLTYCNVGAAASDGVYLRMTVPTNSVFRPAQSTGTWNCTDGAVAGTQCFATVGTTSIGCHFLLFGVQVNNGLPCNGASMPCSTEVVSPCARVTASGSVPVSAVTSMTLTKIGRATNTGTPGSVIIFDLTYSNVGTANAVNSVITETVPQYTNFNASFSSPGWSCQNGGVAGSTCTMTIASIPSGTPAATVQFAVSLAGTVPCPATTVLNSARISDTCDSTDTTVTASVPIVASIQLALSKRDSVGAARPGQYMVYTLTFRNTGTRDANNATLSDVVPAYTTFTTTGSSAGWSCPDGAVAGTNCTLNLGTLVAGAAEQTRLFAVRVTNTIPAGTTNIGNVVNMYTGCNASATASETIPLLGNPDVTVSKRHNSAITYGPGALITFTITVGNIGTAPAPAVRLTENVPAGTTANLGASSAGWTCVGQVCTMTITNLGVGVSQDYQFSINAPTPLNCGTPTYNNTVSVMLTDVSQGTDNNTANDQAFDIVPVTATSVLTISETANVTSVMACDYVGYSIVYANTGTGCDTNVVLTTTVPQYTTYVSGGWSCTAGGAAGSTCTMTIARLCPTGASPVTVPFVVRASCNMDCDADSFQTQVRMVGNCGAAAVSGPVIVTTINGEPDLAVTKSAVNVADGASATPGMTIVYDITITNTGSVNEVDTELTETIPASTMFNAAQSDNAWNCGMTSCTLDSGRLNVGQTKSYRFALDVSRPYIPDDVFNRVVLVGECDSDDHPATVTIPVSGPPDLTLCKRAECASVHFTLDYSNVSPFDATGVVITEHLPEGGILDVTQSTPAGGWNCDMATRVCTLLIGDMPGNTANKAIFAVKPLTKSFGCFHNNASITDDGENGPDPVTINNWGTASMGSECDEPCPECPEPECPSPTPAPSCAPCEECEECVEPCCPEPHCEPCQGDIENQVNFVFAGLIPAPKASELPTCCK